MLVLRADSAYYGCDVIAAALRQGTRYSVTARQDKAVRAAIAGIHADDWTAIKYTDAVFDGQQQRWISGAEVAQIDYTTFTSKPKAKHISAKLIVRRVKDMNPDDQSELFTDYRYAVFTNSLDRPVPSGQQTHYGLIDEMGDHDANKTPVVLSRVQGRGRKDGSRQLPASR